MEPEIIEVTAPVMVSIKLPEFTIEQMTIIRTAFSAYFGNGKPVDELIVDKIAEFIDNIATEHSHRAVVIELSNTKVEVAKEAIAFERGGKSKLVEAKVVVEEVAVV
jgi:hypothetical protein